MPRNWLRCVIGFGGLAVALALTAPATGQPPQPNAELTRILDLMEKRQKQAGIIRLKAEGTRFVPKGAESERFPQVHPDEDRTIRPPTDQTTELRQDIIFDFTGQRYRRQHSEKLGSKFDSWVNVYDGKKTYGSKADLPIEQLDSFKPSSMSVMSGAGKANIFNWEWWPYLISAGFVITHARQPYFMSDFAIPLDKDNLFVHGQGVADGVPCVILRTFPYGPKGREDYFEYAVGRNDGAVRRLTDWRQNRKDGQITISYRKVGDRLAPTSWVSEWYQPKSTNRLFQQEKMKVTLFETGDSLADRFTLTPAVGASIRERQYPEDIQIIRAKDEKVVHYQVDESGRWIEGELIDGQFKPHRRLLWWGIGGGLLVVLLGALGWRLVRRRSPADPANPGTGGAT